MKKMMLVGESGAGKSSLIRALSGGKYAPRRAMAVEYYGAFINTPGEFLENRRFYASLITASADADIVALLHDASRNTSLFPPGIATVFNRDTVGIISKADVINARPDLAERFLRNAGARNIIQVSTHSGKGLEELRSLLA